MTNEYLNAWDKYISDSDNIYSEEELIAFKNGWIFALEYCGRVNRKLWNDAVFPESESNAF